MNPVNLFSNSPAAGSQVVHSQAVAPEPRISINIRPAVAGPDDLAFIDSLQKMHTHMVGWMPRKQLESYLAGGHVLLAEEIRDQMSEISGQNSVASNLTSDFRPLTSGSPLGYCIFKDQYMKRDDVGIIYQLNVMPIRQRNLIGASLIGAVFERAAYGCRLFCCWCAQDIAANWFWESIGFVPLAFRTGSRAKQRIHIFWQRRVREDDETTPYWFPSQTTGGAVAEDRIVLPIPPGTHWRDVKPVILPDQMSEVSDQRSEQKTLPGGAAVRPRPEQVKLSAAQKVAIQRSQSRHLKGVPLGKMAVITGNGFRYVDRPDFVPELDSPEELLESVAEKPRRRRAPWQKHDPKYVAAARELRDRYLEQVNSGFLLPGAGKYDVSRKLIHHRDTETQR